jgi:predicted site-specific integrase-resolvase
MTRDEMMTAGEARERLGISYNNLAKLVREGVLHQEHDPLDRRLRLYRRQEVEELAERSSKSAA